MNLERINTAKGFCAKRSQRIPELHRNKLFSTYFHTAGLFEFDVR